MDGSAQRHVFTERQEATWNGLSTYYFPFCVLQKHASLCYNYL